MGIFDPRTLTKEEIFDVAIFMKNLDNLKHKYTCAVLKSNMDNPDKVFIIKYLIGDITISNCKALVDYYNNLYK